MTARPDAAPARSGSRRARPPAAVRFGLLFAATAAVLLHAVLAPGPVALSPLLLAVGVLVPVRLVQSSFRLGVQRLHVDGAYEAGLLVVLAEVREPWLLLVAGGAVLVSEARARRGLLKALTNLGVVVVPLAAGLALLDVLAPADGWRGWPALVAAVLLVLLLNELLLDAVVAAVTGTRALDLLRRDARSTVVAGAANVVLGLVVLAAVQSDHAELLVALPAVAIALLARQRRDLREDTVSEVLPRMATAAQRLDAGDDDGLVAEVLRRTADVLGLRTVEIVLLGWPGEGDRTTTLRPDGTLRTRAGRTSGGAHVLCRQLVTGSAPPVVLGELRLHFPTTQQLSDSDEQVLTTLVLTAASALARARSHREQTIAARRDHLTGLGNRLALQEELDARLPGLLDAHLEDPAAPGAALLLVDLDHFKEVNDTLGHSAGDGLLVELSARLVRALRPDDVVVRLGGDEFALLLVDVTGPDHARELAEAVRARLAAPVLVGGLELPVEASVGVALAPRDGTGGDDLLRRADVAMYRAKDERNAVVVYDPAMDSGRDQQLSLLGQLQTAIREGQIVVHFQPVVSLADGSVVAAEALVRWQHPEQGLLAPGAFVPAAERTELVVPLTLAVLEHAVAEAVAWRNDRGVPVDLAVNLSPRCLLDRTLPAQVSRVLARHGLPGRRLVLEITETLALSELEVVEEVLASLGELGVRLSLDDFGTGFSSMSALRRLPVAEVKLDRGFVADALTSRGARAVVDATVTLAHGLGLPVVGEGVETEEQLDLLRAAGCDRVQGFLLGRPVPAADFRLRLREPARR